MGILKLSSGVRWLECDVLAEFAFDVAALVAELDVECRQAARDLDVGQWGWTALCRSPEAVMKCKVELQKLSPAAK
jgi:hypothetical protein